VVHTSRECYTKFEKGGSGVNEEKKAKSGEYLKRGGDSEEVPKEVPVGRLTEYPRKRLPSWDGSGLCVGKSRVQGEDLAEWAARTVVHGGAEA